MVIIKPCDNEEKNTQFSHKLFRLGPPEETKHNTYSTNLAPFNEASGVYRIVPMLIQYSKL